MSARWELDNEGDPCFDAVAGDYVCIEPLGQGPVSSGSLAVSPNAHAALVATIRDAEKWRTWLEMTRELALDDARSES